MAVLRIAGARPLEGFRRGSVVAEPRLGLAEREPGRGEGWRHLGRLLVEIGRRRKIAALFELLAEFEAPVGNQVAGRDEELHRGT